MPQLLRANENNNMEFLEHRDQTVCFTGHRPEKFLNDDLYPESAVINGIKCLLTMMTADAYQRGARYFITGMARGVDLWAGEILLYMKRFLPDVHIVAAVPCPGHEKGMRADDKPIMYQTAAAADAVICVSPAYSAGCFHERNDYMLRASSAVLGVIHDEKGGTAYTLRNAVRYCVQRRIVDIRDYRRMFPLFERYPECCLMVTPAQRYALWEKHPRVLYQCGLFSED